MNPKRLFTLTANEQATYQLQPDGFLDYNREQDTEEYEIPPFISKTLLRFWYNTQNVGFSTHWHDAQEIIIPLEGDYTVIVQDVTYNLKPGDILVIPPGILHTILAPSGGTRFIFLQELNVFCQLTDFFHTQALMTKPILMNTDTYSQIYENEITLLMQAASHYWGNSPSKQLLIYACMMNFYACYTEFCTEQKSLTLKASGNLSLKNYPQKLMRLLEYLQLHYTENISLEDAAQKVGLSKFYFSRVFKQYTGQTFYDYLSFLRIQTAETLLKDTSTPISEISNACGYSNISSFNRSFRKFQKCTPSEYRHFHGHGM